MLALEGLTAIAMEYQPWEPSVLGALVMVVQVAPPSALFWMLSRP